MSVYRSLSICQDYAFYLHIRISPFCLAVCPDIMRYQMSFFQAHILLDCGDDNVCRPDLRLEVKRSTLGLCCILCRFFPSKKEKRQLFRRPIMLYECVWACVHVGMCACGLRSLVFTPSYVHTVLRPVQNLKDASVPFFKCILQLVNL